MRCWPMEAGVLLTSGFGPRDGGFHWGTDLGWPGGSGGLPVYAMQGGTVDRVGPASGFGQWVCLDHGVDDGTGYTVYGHVIPEVALGQRVEAGQRIARINPNSHTNGGVPPHLHIEVHEFTWVRPGTGRLDPLPWLAQATYPGEPAQGGHMDLMPYREQMNGLWSSPAPTRQVIVQHTTESESGNSNVIDYLEKTGNGSYQTMIDTDGEEVRMVPDDQQAWAAMAAGNRIGLHVCAMGRAVYARDRWLPEQALLERTAMRYAEWSRLYGIPLVKIGPDDVRAGKRGVCGHIDISGAFHESDHTDPGGNFPYDRVIARAKELLDPKQETPMSAAEIKQLEDFITGFCAPIGSDVKDLREQACGAGQRDAGQYGGWPQLGGRTLVDAVAVIGATLGIVGFTPPKAPGK